jgi:hypothetical protein
VIRRTPAAFVPRLRHPPSRDRDALASATPRHATRLAPYASGVAPEAQAPAWLLWPARALAVVVVVPLRLGWHAITAVLRGMGWLIDRAVVRPVAWAWRHLVVVPLAWLWRYLVAVPLTWLWSEVFRPVFAVVVRSAFDNDLVRSSGGRRGGLTET